MDVVVERLSAPLFAVVRPQSDFFWLYLLTFTTLCWVLYRARGAGPPRLKAFLAFAFPGHVYRHPSARLDVAIWALNLWIVVPTTGLSIALASAVGGALAAMSGPVAMPPPRTIAVEAAYTLVVVAMADFGVFFGHWLLHRVAPLWEFHKVHHSAVVLTPVTAFRQHPVDGLVTGLCGATMLGLGSGLFSWLSPDIGMMEIAQRNAVDFVFILTVAHFRHTHISIAWGPRLAHVFISPAQHQIHHSTQPRHHNRNMGVIFALWDWAFGTLALPQPEEALTYGLGPEQDDQFRTLWRCYAAPFPAAWRRLMTGRSSR